VIGAAIVFASGGNNSAFNVHASGPTPKILKHYNMNNCC
jgi:hypothetical protein